ncbi:PGRP2 amidase, partial [Brachypteracias leptosomus]|nr:PGRP2 amidase [Brachypteracias leptosomus]
PRHMDTVVTMVEALEMSTHHGAPSTLLELARALGSCSTPGCRVVLGDPPTAPSEVPPGLDHHQWVLLTQLFHHDPTTTPELGAVLAPDGSTVTLGPLFAGIEVGLKKVLGWPGPTTEPPLDALAAATLTETLATSFLMARGDPNRTTLGPTGCWDDVGDPQTYTLVGPSSPVPDAVANGAMDGVVLGTYVAEGAANLSGGVLGAHPSQGATNLSGLLRGYYGTGNGTEKGRPPNLLPPLLHPLPECPPIVPRCMWGARPYRGVPTPLTLPLGSIFIHHTFQPSAPCRTFSSCSKDMRDMQKFHQDTRDWDDIGYSFVVGSDGYIYQGRGWHWVGAHTKGYNTRGYGVGYVGDFSSTLPDPDTISLVRDQLLPCAVKTGRLHQNFTLRGHRQMGPTSCPGNSLFQEIETWRGFE